MPQVTDNEAERRYELKADGGTAVAYYEDRAGARAFTHTIVPTELRGQGIGSALIKGALSEARRRGLRIVADCSFVAAYVADHPDEQDLLA